MPRDVFPETKLNISMAFQLSDCPAVEGSNVIMSQCQPLDGKARAPDWEAHFIKPPEFQYVLF